MAKRGEIREFGPAWLQGHGLTVGSALMDRFHRVRRAAPSLDMQPVEPVAASCGAAVTAILKHAGAPSQTISTDEVRCASEKKANARA